MPPCILIGWNCPSEEGTRGQLEQSPISRVHTAMASNLVTGSLNSSAVISRPLICQYMTSCNMREGPLYRFRSPYIATFLCTCPRNMSVVSLSSLSLRSSVSTTLWMMSFICCLCKWHSTAERTCIPLTRGVCLVHSRECTGLVVCTVFTTCHALRKVQHSLTCNWLDSAATWRSKGCACENDSACKRSLASCHMRLGGHYVLAASFCLSLYDLHALNKDDNMIQTNKQNK